MARSKVHKVQHRRRREGKTDYRLRLKLLRSKKPRFVVRKSSNNITCQVIEYSNRGDNVLAYSDSRELKKLGWKAHAGNIPAAYLTGLLCGTRSKKKKIGEAVPDMGLYTSTKGSRLYGALKGALDGGLKIPCSEDIMPSEERISGKHIQDKKDIQKNFEAVKKKILTGSRKTP